MMSRYDYDSDDTMIIHENVDCDNCDKSCLLSNKMEKRITKKMHTFINCIFSLFNCGSYRRFN